MKNRQNSPGILTYYQGAKGLPKTIFDLFSTTEQAVKAMVATINTQYITYVIRKSDGVSKRIIDAPQTDLKTMQSNFLNNVLYKFRPHNFAHGFVVGKSPKTNAISHVGAKSLIKLDIKNFFNSIHEARVLSLIDSMGSSLIKRKLIDTPITESQKELLARLVTFKHRLPQGAPTSPTLANLAAYKMDKILEGVSKKFKVVITRYADDITISSKVKLPKATVGRIITEVTQAARVINLTINTKKTKVRTAAARLQVTGVVVNSKPNIPQNDYRLMRAKVHNHVTGKTVLAKEELESLRGQIEWLRSINPARGQQLIAQLGLTQSKKA